MVVIADDVGVLSSSAGKSTRDMRLRYHHVPGRLFGRHDLRLLILNWVLHGLDGWMRLGRITRMSRRSACELLTKGACCSMGMKPKKCVDASS